MLIVDVFEKLEKAKVAVDQQRCVRVRNRHATCRACADACVSGCIDYADNELTVDPTECIGCGTCATTCPTDALAPVSPTDDELLGQCLSSGTRNNGRIVIACRRMLDAAAGLIDEDAIAAVVCLGRVDHAILLRLAASGARSITLVSGECESCPSARGGSVARSVAESANEILDVWGSAAIVVVQDRLPAYTRSKTASDHDESKRAFFATMADGAKDVAGAVAESVIGDAADLDADGEEAPSRFAHVDETGTLPHAVSARCQALLAALDAFEDAFGEPKDVMIDAPLWSEVVIDAETCRSCRMCATFCPTGANAKFEDDDGTFGVLHRVRDCCRCRLCADICPSGALELSPEVFARDVAHGVIERYEMHGRRPARKGDAMLESMQARMKRSGVHVTPA